MILFDEVLTVNSKGASSIDDLVVVDDGRTEIVVWVDSELLVGGAGSEAAAASFLDACT